MGGSEIEDLVARRVLVGPSQPKQGQPSHDDPRAHVRPHRTGGSTTAQQPWNGGKGQEHCTDTERTAEVMSSSVLAEWADLRFGVRRDNCAAAKRSGPERDVGGDRHAGDHHHNERSPRQGNRQSPSWSHSTRLPDRAL